MLLLNRGADFTVRNDSGQTALYWAACNGQYNVVKLLLEKGRIRVLETMKA